MPANWDSTLHLNQATGFVEWPEGPLSPDGDETILRVEAWVMQATTGAVQMTYQTAFNTHPVSRWKADQVWYPQAGTPGTPWANGLFEPGPALGTAVAIATKGNVQSYYWWSQEVELS